MADKTVKLKALKNIPLSMCGGDIPAKLEKHPGGARVERGTEITVSAATAETLKKLKYAA